MVMRENSEGPLILEKVEIVDAGSEGMAVGKSGEMVVFVPFAVPGDIVDVRIVKKRKRYAEGRIIRVHQYSDKRTDAFCSHFGTCGGCRWQNMRYEEQLFYKRKQVYDNLIRIGKVNNPEILPILPSPTTTHYRNKLEYTFSNHRWLTDEDKKGESLLPHTNALGFHIPQFWDKVVDIQQCFHQSDPSNAIRDAARDYALDNGLTFYDARRWDGFLRNLIIRNTRAGGLMVILVVKDPDEELLVPMLDHLSSRFPAITSLYYVVNGKQNDTLSDLEFQLYNGEPYITETMAPFRERGKEITFRIGPSSFFQTNPAQAENLYRLTAEYAGLTGEEIVYDLYTGAGAIACYTASYAGKVVGIESAAAAIRDAETNAGINGFTNTIFFAGEAEKILTPEFFAGQGKPEVIITDPPRSGMHEKVVRAILAAAPARLVYVSCNPATQARDIALLSEDYCFAGCTPVDMFPHTQHVENVALLKRKDQTA
jgi:23S rRNA (uracil1939-C5)-methyltransferase